MGNTRYIILSVVMLQGAGMFIYPLVLSDYFFILQDPVT